jgi:hypothetical protein
MPSVPKYFLDIQFRPQIVLRFGFAIFAGKRDITKCEYATRFPKNSFPFFP